MGRAINDKDKDLDKFYTNDDISFHCMNKITSIVGKDKKFIEPSAGGGSFIRSAKKLNLSIKGYDIHPEYPEVEKKDFFHLSPFDFEYHETVIVGNPPFGKKSNLAIQFLNGSLNLGSYVGFILPNQFDKWSVQSKIDNSAKLIHNEDLPENSFNFKGKPYKVRCLFQIWTTEKNHIDLRIKDKPETNHMDFTLYQYNRTVESEKYFDYDWDFALPRQGFYDYTKPITNKDECDKKKQWIFFKANNENILNTLLRINYKELSEKNTSIPGFGKADVIQAYKALKDSEK